MKTPTPSIREQAEGLVLSGILCCFALLPMDAASWLGGALGRLIGPRLGITRRARRNLSRVLPERADEHGRIIREMWDNLGRVVAEYAHLVKLREPKHRHRMEVSGAEHIRAAFARGQACIVFSGHIANWEVPCVAASNEEMDVLQVYRAANNPVVEAKMAAFRHSIGVEAVPKGAGGARKLIAALKSHRLLALLIDQKMNDGIAVPFFGREAMTVSAPADLSLRYNAALFPCQVVRLSGMRFRVTVLPPITPPETGNHHNDVRVIMTEANRLLEDWIRENPGQWFWLHRRWPDS